MKDPETKECKICRQIPCCKAYNGCFNTPPETSRLMEPIIKKAIEGGWGQGRIFNLAENGGFYSSQGLTREEAERWKNDYHPKAEIILHEFKREIFFEAILSSSFWQALFKEYRPGLTFHIHQRTWPQWKQQACRFHEINLTEGWDKAVEYLKSITN